MLLLFTVSYFSRQFFVLIKSLVKIYLYIFSFTIYFYLFAHNCLSDDEKNAIYLWRNLSDILNLRIFHHFNFCVVQFMRYCKAWIYFLCTQLLSTTNVGNRKCLKHLYTYICSINTLVFKIKSLFQFGQLSSGLLDRLLLKWGMHKHIGWYNAAKVKIQHLKCIYMINVRINSEGK